MKKIVLKITVLSIIMLMMISVLQSILGNGGVKAAESVRYVYTYCKNKNQIDSSIDGLINKNTEKAVKNYVEYQYNVTYKTAVILYDIPKADLYKFGNKKLVYGATANDEQVIFEMSNVMIVKKSNSNNYTVQFLLSSTNSLITPYTTRDFYSAFRKSYDVTIKFDEKNKQTIIPKSSLNLIKVTWKITPISGSTNTTSTRKPNIRLNIPKIINK